VLRTSAWLCDIGLIGVSRELLRAFRTQQPLGDTEQTILRNHRSTARRSPRSSTTSPPSATPSGPTTNAGTAAAIRTT